MVFAQASEVGLGFWREGHCKGPQRFPAVLTQPVPGRDQQGQTDRLTDGGHPVIRQTVGLEKSGQPPGFVEVQS